MPDLRRITRASLNSVVDWFGCLEAVAETINARWGEGASKGTISKKVSGALDWTVADMIAIEDAAGRYPVTRALARRLEDRVDVDAKCLIVQSGAIAKESGEAISAIIRAGQSSDVDERAAAITEIDEALQALREARARLENPQSRGVPS